jgi:hypothetical protein
MGFLIFLGIFIGLFFLVAFITFTLRDKKGEKGYDQPSSCPKCRKD